MAKSVRTLEITPALLLRLETQGPSCFLCRLIYEDLKANGKLTGYPLDYAGGAEFPVPGKIRHLELEGFIPTLDQVG